MVNLGLIQVSDGQLSFYGSALDNTEGLIKIDDGATLYAGNAPVTGGTIRGLPSGNGIATLAGGTYRNLTLTGNLAVNSVTIAGTITNNGTLNAGSSLLSFNGATTLTGTGKVTLAGGIIDSTSSNNTFTVGKNQSIQGHGQLGGYYGYNSTFINQGTLRASGTNGLRFYSSNALQNQGLVLVDANSTFNLNGTQLTQTAADARTVVNGTLNTPVLALQAGTVSGTGTIAGNVNNTGGVLNPGASPGTLTITGDYAQASGGSLTIELDGEEQGVSFDWLTIGGNATLAGNLFLDVGFTPADGTTFTFLTTSGLVSGAFEHIYANGWDVLTTYTDHSVSVTLTAAVPEPETWALLLAGVAVLGTFGARQRRKPNAQPDLAPADIT